MRHLGFIRAVALAIALAASSISQAQVLDEATRDSLLGAATNAATSPQVPWRSDLLPPAVVIGNEPPVFAGGAPGPATMNLVHVAPPPAIALAWAAQAPALAFGDERVRTMPSFSMVEPMPTPAPPQMLSGGLHLPRALFFFDAPLALNFALIQPVPEPGTLGLMLAGLGVVALVGRARRGRDQAPQRQ